jgi:hypothetical protein
MSKKTQQHKDGSITLSQEDANTLLDALWVLHIAMQDLNELFDFGGEETDE